ncbi:MAG: hypothetical protein H6819_10930 [Phycisphaerales bacterium]|nr:hypothetical protein [Phycisphaerales bacterium]MCB9855601.1 hypothetical protein [Phycisphaerales bacterium]MCB9864910.1 hypothetical protein [Phycisphaerales bacterium]
MKDRIPDNSSAVDDRAERLIVRSLDGEITPAEQIELDELLSNRPELVALFQEYRRIDALASDALYADFNAAHAPVGQPAAAAQVAHHWSRSVKVGLMTALLAAAAVIVVASLPLQWFSGSVANNDQPKREWPHHETRTPAAPMLVDYQRPVYQPQRLEGDVFRDVIGVQGDNPNVIIIIERLTRQSRLETVAGEF